MIFIGKKDRNYYYTLTWKWNETHFDNISVSAVMRINKIKELSIYRLLSYPRKTFVSKSNSLIITVDFYLILNWLESDKNCHGPAGFSPHNSNGGSSTDGQSLTTAVGQPLAAGQHSQTAIINILFIQAPPTYGAHRASADTLTHLTGLLPPRTRQSWAVFCNWALRL